MSDYCFKFYSAKITNSSYRTKSLTIKVIYYPMG